MKSMLTLTAAVHPGRCSPLGACRRLAALCSPLWGTTELRAVGQRRLALTAVGTERSTATQNIVPLLFYLALTLSKVDPSKYAVRVGNSSRLRGGRGVSRGAENVLRTEESALEKQVSMRSWGQLFPTLQRFWCLGDNCRLSECCPESVHQPAFTPSPHPPTHRHAHTAAANPSRSWTRLSGFHLPLIPCCYPVGMKLCNTWVLSCQHHLQILACRGADRSVWGDADECVCVLLFTAFVNSPQKLLRFIQWLFFPWQCAWNMLQCILHGTEQCLLCFGMKCCLVVLVQWWETNLKSPSEVPASCICLTFLIMIHA